MWQRPSKEKLLQFEHKGRMNTTVENLNVSQSPLLLKPVVRTELISSKPQKSSQNPSLLTTDINNASESKLAAKENCEPGTRSKSVSPLLFDSEGENEDNIEEVVSVITGEKSSHLDRIQEDLYSKFSVIAESPVKSSSPPMDLSSGDAPKQPLFKRTGAKEENEIKTEEITLGEVKKEEIKTENVPDKGEKRSRLSSRNRLSFSRCKSEDKLNITSDMSNTSNKDQNETLRDNKDFKVKQNFEHTEKTNQTEDFQSKLKLLLHVIKN